MTDTDYLVGCCEGRTNVVITLVETLWSLPHMQSPAFYTLLDLFVEYALRQYFHLSGQFHIRLQLARIVTFAYTNYGNASQTGIALSSVFGVPSMFALAQEIRNTLRFTSLVQVHCTSGQVDTLQGHWD